MLRPATRVPQHTVPRITCGPVAAGLAYALEPVRAQTATNRPSTSTGTTSLESTCSAIVTSSA